MVGQRFRAQTKRWISPHLFRLARLGRCLPPPQGCLIVTFHRIVDAAAIGPFGHTVWGGSPATFAATVAWLKRHFHLITLEELLAALNGHRLPPRALLLTFDDGYRDLFLHAFPILRQLKAPATVFVTTDVIDHADALLWMDRLSYALWTTRNETVECPGLGLIRLADETLRRAAYGRIIGRLKRIDESQRRRELEQLLALLKVTFPSRVAEGVYLSSEEIRTMSRHEISIGSHTCSHPILSRISGSALRREIVESKALLEAMIERPVTAFAYPNGTPADYTDETIALLREAGFRAAMTTVPGVNRLDRQRDPFRLKRIHAGEGSGALQYLLGRTGVIERFPVLRGRSKRDHQIEDAREALAAS